jgi:hypothetical protein
MANDIAIANSFAVTKNSLGTWIPGTPSWTKTVSNKSKASNEAILLTTLSWNMSGCVLASYTFISGNGSMNATATKCKHESRFPLRKTDNGMCSGVFNLTASPFTPLACSCRFEITNAGQSKAKCE